MQRLAAEKISAMFLLIFAWQGFGQITPSVPPFHFHFREPRLMGYIVENGTSNRVAKTTAGTAPKSVKAWSENGSSNYVEFTSRVVLQLKTAEDLKDLLHGRDLSFSRKVNETLFILEAPDVWAALNQSEQLSGDPRVLACYPVPRRLKRLGGQYALRPNDPFFFGSEHWQANLENRDTNGLPLGIDLNVRSAWPVTQGEGITIALGDDGVELDHPDLIERTQGAPHYNFITATNDGMPTKIFSRHATAVAGLAASTANNKIGGTGVAPKARLASWVIFDPTDYVNEFLGVSEEQLMDMFQFQSNIVSVQNHSWGNSDSEQVHLGTLENVAISNAVYLGRSGRGVVIVRAAGNGREGGDNANDDGYLADPRIIAVAAARLDGKVTRYSAPGACVLVAAPSGDIGPGSDPCFADSPNLVTTDRQGDLGYNQNTASEGGGDYAYGEDGFSGTSGATPQIAGVAALILGANPNLTYRDVQQILIHSARHYDLSDPTLTTNGAGFSVSDNLGFGVPDAGVAVRLAIMWPNRPPLKTVTYEATNSAAIPDLGMRLRLQADGLPDSLSAIIALPGWGPHPGEGTPMLPLVDVGTASDPITTDLRGKAALIKRGVNFFCDKITKAAQAGAEFAVIYNNTNGDSRIMMVGTDLTPIPSVFISQNDGEALASFLGGQPSVAAQVTLDSTNYSFQVGETFQCEFVGVNIDSDHTARGDLRIVLTSPSGTRSVLQRVNSDALMGPSDWTYYSVHNFYESSFGKWTVSISDEDEKGTGSILRVKLIITGVPLNDSDHDGLDDDWERGHFGTLAYGPADDPDRDGYSNAREQVLGTDPNSADNPLSLDLSLWDSRLARLSWASSTNASYRVQMGAETAAPLTLITNLPGGLRETEWFVPYTNLLHQFFRLESVPRQ